MNKDNIVDFPKREIARLDLPIGIAVRKARASRGLTQKQVAVRMGCQRTYISKIENGAASPLLEQFVRICDAMEIEPWRVLRLTCKLKDKVKTAA